MKSLRTTFFVCALWLTLDGWLARGQATDWPDPAADPVVRAVQKVLPSVVNVRTERLLERTYRDPFEEIWRDFFGYSRQPPTDGSHNLGSGVVVDEDGWIVTNWHVVRRADRIKVKFADGAEYDALYVSGDENNDLALLKIEPKKPVTFVDLALDRDPFLGETVIAVGNPFGLEQTVTKGVVSAKNRKYGDGAVQFNDILQTDAAINPGNSGGPLINTRGELVGINMAILSQAEGIGFAIPSSRVANMLARWLSPEKRARIWFGARLANDRGNIMVVEVQPDSPCARAGLAVGDRVGMVDNAGFRDVVRLMRHLTKKKLGDRVTLEVEREGRTRKVSVTLAELPQYSAEEQMRAKFGLHIQALRADLAQAMGFAFEGGLLVTEVDKDSPAADAGLRRGMAITHVGGLEIQKMDLLGEQLADMQRDESVTMVVVWVERRGNYKLQRSGSVALKSR
jgi:S1-C subfamily serine protease